MGGQYRARRDHGLEPQQPTNNSASARPISYYSFPSEDQTSHIAQNVINDYQPPDKDDDTNNYSPPPSPLISTVSKGLQSITKKIGAIVKKTKDDSTPSSSTTAPKLHSPVPPRRQAKRTESPDSLYLGPGSNDDNDWPNGMRLVGRDGGDDGRSYYRDQNGVGYQTDEGCKYGWITRMD